MTLKSSSFPTYSNFESIKNKYCLLVFFRFSHVLFAYWYLVIIALENLSTEKNSWLSAEKGCSVWLSDGSGFIRPSLCGCCLSGRDQEIECGRQQ